MSDVTIRRVWQALRVALVANTATLLCATLVVVFAYCETAPAQDVSGILAVSREIAEAAPLDLTRLALQVALASILCNVVLVAMAFRLVFGFARKPCLLAAQEARAILREAVREARHDREQI